ncbi:hypothetical protein JCM17823_13400 [Halorubrum gandharaense]
MHEPGPPRTTTVGDSVELVPRSPDPAGTYEWTLTTTPANSDAAEGTTPAARDGDGVLLAGETSRGDTPVVHLHPDAPGEYVLELDAPDGTHRQRVRVFPDERVSTTVRVPAADLPLPPEEVEDVSVMAAFNDRLLARDRPEKRGDEWVWETRLQPGRHRFSFVANDDLIENPHQAVHEVEGPGRPHCSVDTHVEADAVHLSATVGLPPNSSLAATDADPADATDDADATFLVDDRDADPETVADLEARAADGELVVPQLSVPEDDGLRVHVVPHAERLGAAETVRIERDAGAASSSADDDAADLTADLIASDPHATPEWAESPTIYEVYVRSFAGDTLPTTFTEIERRVPYIESLGVDVLWLTPVLASPTEHGYHITDFFDTADDLGTRAEFESLVDACHDAGIRVVFDLVINHSSRDHPYFQMHSAGVDAYRDYYRRAPGEFDVTDTDWAELAPGDMPEYYFNWRRIPNLNFDSPEVRSWLLDIVDEWAAVVDGFRCDVAWGVPHGFWKAVAERTPDDFLLLDETIPHDPFYGEGEFDLHYDTSLFHALEAIGAGEEPADHVSDALDRGTWLGFEPGGFDQMRYVENHDEDRYFAEYGEAAQRAAGAVTFTLPGAPMIYAGQERGNETYRGPIRWHDGDNALTDFYRDLAALRDAEPLLREGSVSFDGPAADVTVAAGDADRVVAYTRETTDDDAGAAEAGDAADDAATDALLVVVNFGEAPATVGLPPAFAGATDRFAEATPHDGRLGVETVAVLRRN